MENGKTKKINTRKEREHYHTFIFTFISCNAIFLNKVSQKFTAHEIWLQWPYSENF